MTVNVDEMLGHLDPQVINTTVMMPHDLARESFPLGVVQVRDHREFQYLVSHYVQYHYERVGWGRPSDVAAFGEARRILDRAFNQDQYQDGYARARRMATEAAGGGMRSILNEIADALKRRALNDYMDRVYHYFVDDLSKEDNLEISRSFFERFGPILRRFGHEVDPYTFAFNTRGALQYYHDVLEHIFRIARTI